jgi:hypothetical protein
MVVLGVWYGSAIKVLRVEAGKGMGCVKSSWREGYNWGKQKGAGAGVATGVNKREQEQG